MPATGVPTLPPSFSSWALAYLRRRQRGARLPDGVDVHRELVDRRAEDDDLDLLGERLELVGGDPHGLGRLVHGLGVAGVEHLLERHRPPVVRHREPDPGLGRLDPHAAAGSSGVPVADGDALALALAAVDPAVAADSVVDGDWPPHPATASAAMVTATDDLATVLFPLMAHTVAASEVTSRRARGTAVSGPEGAGGVSGVGSGPEFAGKVPPRASPGQVRRLLTGRLEPEITPKAFVALGRAP